LDRERTAQAYKRNEKLQRNCDARDARSNRPAEPVGKPARGDNEAIRRGQITFPFQIPNLK
jgi:hypothetical protein